MSDSSPTQPGPTPGPDRGARPDRGAQPGGAPASAGTSPDKARKGKKPDQGGKGAGAGGKQSDPLRRSRASGFYVGVIALGVLLVFLIIFVAQNTDPATVRFLGWEADIPVAVALLIAAVAGIFLAGIAASLRILQLRRRVKHDRKG